MILRNFIPAKIYIPFQLIPHLELPRIFSRTESPITSVLLANLIDTTPSPWHLTLFIGLGLFAGFLTTVIVSFKLLRRRTRVRYIESSKPLITISNTFTLKNDQHVNSPPNFN